MRIQRFRSMIVAGALALPAVACSAASDTESSAAAIANAQACPSGLIDVVRSDDDWHLFSPKVADACLVDGRDAKAAPTSTQLEGYLAQHPFVALGKPSDFLATCMTSGAGSSFDDDHKRAVVGNYYYLMNSLKQDALATLEGLAGVNMLLGSEPLPAVEGFSYSHPYLHESADWERRLKAKCEGDPSRTEALVQFTNGVLWQVRKLSAAIYEGRMTEQAYMGDLSDEATARRKRIDAIVEARNVLVQSIAPWLDGKEMKGLIEFEYELSDMVALENRFELVDETGMTRLKEFWKDGQNPENPMLAQERAVRAAFTKQLATTRETMMNHLRKLQKAADYLHLNEDSNLSDGKYQEIMAEVVPFDPDVFASYYDSDDFKRRFSEETLAALETDVRAKLAPGATWPEAKDVTQRLLRIEVGLTQVQDPELQTRAEKLRASYEDATNGFKAGAELADAKCRNERRSSYQWRNQLAWELGLAAAITVVTFGMGSWMSAARVASVLGEAAVVGLGWARTARVSVLSARGAMGLARTGVSYQNQARVLWGVLLGANGYFTLEGVGYAISACNDLINDNMLQMFERPFDLGQVQCLEGKSALSHQAVADYKGCAVNAVMVGALTLVGVYAGAKELRHVPIRINGSSPR